MAGAARFKKNKFAEQFAGREISLLRSPAFRVLSLTAHRILFRLEIELAQHGGTGNGSLPCTYEHFVEYGLERDAIPPALRELEALGFIGIVPGAAGNTVHKRPSLFRLTYKHTEKNAATDEWRRIKSDEQAIAIARNARSTSMKDHRARMAQRS